MRNVSADFCAETGAAPSSTAPRIAPSFTIRMLLSLRPGSSQVALYHRAAIADHGLRRLDAAALDRDTAARMKAAAGGISAGSGRVSPRPTSGTPRPGSGVSTLASNACV